MAVNRWWAADTDERFWIEVTDREDLGADLRAPAADDAGRDNWRYTLLREVQPGDVVYHYVKQNEAVVGYSVAASSAYPAQINWGARGTYARTKGTVPRERPGLRVDLNGYSPLASPLTIAVIRKHESAVRSLRDALRAKHDSKAIYFPLELSSKRPVRPLQGYIFKLPGAFVHLFPHLEAWPSPRTVHERLSSAQLARVESDHIWRAVERLRDGFRDHAFGDSTDYDLLTGDGQRLAPKAVFGVAATEALGFSVAPSQFIGGENSPCFRLLREAGYEVVPKVSATEPQRDEPDFRDREWDEGDPRLRVHLKRERARGLSQAKRADFRREHGRIFCERCGFDPVAFFDGVAGEAAIEVHHREVAISDMRAGHKTRLEDLMCLCANCHRVVHRLSRTV